VWRRRKKQTMRYEEGHRNSVEKEKDQRSVLFSSQQADDNPFSLLTTLSWKTDYQDN
jgi:hypothetical protein